MICKFSGYQLDIDASVQYMDGIIAFMQSSFHDIRIVERHPSSIKFRIPKAIPADDIKDGTASWSFIHAMTLVIMVPFFGFTALQGPSVYMDSIADTDHAGILNVGTKNGSPASTDSRSLADIFR